MTWLLLASCRAPAPGDPPPDAPRPEEADPSMGGQVGETSTPPGTVGAGLHRVPGARAARGGELLALVGATVASLPGEDLGGDLADLGHAVAVAGRVGGADRVWLLPASLVAGGGSTSDALATLDLDGPLGLGSAGDLDGDGASELAVADGSGRVLLVTADLRGPATADEAWATLDGDVAGRPVPVPGGLVVAHRDADGLRLWAWLDPTGGVHEVIGGILLPDGALGVSPLGDVDGDGIRDLWVSGSGRGWIVSGGPGLEGALVVLAELEAADPPVDAGDVDGDGLDDLALRRVDARGGVHLGLVTGAGSQVDLAPVGPLEPLTAADLDGDGVRELIAATGGGFDVISAAAPLDPDWDGGAAARLDGSGRVHPVGDLDGDGTEDLILAW